MGTWHFCNENYEFDTTFKFHACLNYNRIVFMTLLQMYGNIRFSSCTSNIIKSKAHPIFRQKHNDYSFASRRNDSFAIYLIFKASVKEEYIKIRKPKINSKSFMS